MKTFLHCFLIAFLITASIVAIIYMIFPTSPIQVLLPQIVKTEIKKDGSVKNFKVLLFKLSLLLI